MGRGDGVAVPGCEGEDGEPPVVPVTAPTGTAPVTPGVSPVVVGFWGTVRGLCGVVVRVVPPRTQTPSLRGVVLSSTLWGIERDPTSTLDPPR